MLSRREALAIPAACCLCGNPFLRSASAADKDDPTKVFTDGKKPTDARLGPPKTLNDYFPFTPPKTKEAWEARRKQLRAQLLVATGLWPLPEKTPLNAVVHGKIERDGYTIEKVYFASMPGHYVCGNLYRPAGGESDKSKKKPAVLCPHGHWANGRFYEADAKAIAADKKRGAETTDAGAKSPLQARCANLAMMGFVVFHYDMVGYADSTAIPHRAGFTDAAAELRQQNFMGLQTWNSVRALDFVESLPDVDPKKIGVTGASGGGTQTFMLCAIDDRPAAAFPAVMVSTAMQGGCVCENCSHLRVNTGNVEIAALFAPKPQAFSCANDWTKEFMTKGFPQLQELYALYGAKDKVAAKAWLDFPHNYSQPSREFMYSWFSKWLLGKNGPVEEKPFTFTPPKELSVFDAAHPRPKDELNAAKLREEMTKASDEQMAKLTPKDAASLKEFRRVVGTALRVMVPDALLSPTQNRSMSFRPTGQPAGWPQKLELRNGVLGRGKESDEKKPARPTSAEGIGESVPFTHLLNWTKKGSGTDCVVWIHSAGKSSLFEKGKLAPAARALVDAGCHVIAVDTFLTGEQVREKPFPVDQSFAGYTYGYNPTLLAQRVRDVVLAVDFARGYTRDEEGKHKGKVYLVGWDEFGPIAILAKALAGDAVAKTAADLNGFRFEDIKDAADPMMLPGAVKYGGLGAFLALCAPGEVLVHNQKGTDTGRISRAAYEAAGAANKLTRNAAKLDPAKVVEWLVK
jgi:hypothetical protein